MKNKDQSYIEYIAVIITVLLIIVSITLIITNYFKKEKIRKYNDYEMLITESTYKYLDNHKDIIEKLKKDYAYINLKVEDLVKDSYLNNDIKNPKTKNVTIIYRRHGVNFHLLHHLMTGTHNKIIKIKISIFSTRNIHRKPPDKINSRFSQLLQTSLNCNGATP